MKRRSRAGGKASKAQGREASKIKRRGASETASSSAPIQDAEIARLTRELNEAREQQSAAAQVLDVIRRSSGDLEPVFATIQKNATRVSDANFGVMALYEGEDRFRVVAMHNVAPAYAELRRRDPVISPLPFARMVTTKKPFQIPDMTELPAYKEKTDPNLVSFIDLTGVRTNVGVPLLADNRLVGVITVYRTTVRAFTDKQMELLRNFGAQAVIAIENARLLNELREALEQQTATSEVLQVISSSPGELEPVFQAMLENATRICEAKFGLLLRFDGDAFHMAASVGTPPELSEFLWRRGAFQPVAGSHLDRLTRTKQVSHTADYAAEGVPSPPVTLGGARSTVDVPMLKDDKLIGAFSIYRQEVRPFTDKQIELVKNFAAQAVIAIENARLLNELRQRTTDLTERTADLTEALEQQRATSEVLRVISSSPGDLEPVFASMLENAVRICDATFGNIYHWDGEALHLLATHNTPPAFAEARRRSPRYPDANTPAGRVAVTKTVVHVADLAAEQAYIGQRDPATVAAVELGGVRTFLAVPMLKENRLIGTFALARQEVRPFTDKQIELVKNFAAQAVIAIENARLLSELRQRTTDLSQRTTDLTEALEQQTATSKVLQVISSSPGDLVPVFATMLENAVRVCDATFGTIYGLEGDAFRLVARHNAPPALAAAPRQAYYHPGQNTPLGRMFSTKQVVQVPDLAAEQSYIEQREPGVTAAVELGGVRTILAVPMLKESELVGGFLLFHQEVRPFTDKQIELVKNFAAQAVIAIENARLLNELRGALERQTATSEVLQVISGSPGDLEPVFAAMLESAVRTCGAKFGNIYRVEGGGLSNVATHNTPTAFAEALRGSPYFSPGPNNPVRRMMQTKTIVHVPDVAASEAYAEREPITVASVELGQTRTLMIVPMLKDNELVGAFTLARQEVRPFTDKQIELVQNFAAQAVIAIENTRLLNDLHERTDQLQAQSKELADLNQQLEQRVSEQVGEIERTGRLRRFLPPQVADLIVASGSEKQLESHRREITALFCDLRGFTGFTESADAEDVIALLREYHAAVGEKIIKYSGTLERYAGDGVMVVFNDPVPVENPALQAVLMALEMREAIGALTETWHRWGHDIGFGIGIAHGFATLGTIGFEGRFDYAAIGTVSNVASRLCDEAKPGQILISPRVLTKVENAVKVEPVGEFALKGIRRPLGAYNVVAALDAKA